MQDDINCSFLYHERQFALSNVTENMPLVFALDRQVTSRSTANVNLKLELANEIFNAILITFISINRKHGRRWLEP